MTKNQEPKELEDNIFKKQLQFAQLGNNGSDINEALINMLQAREQNKKEILEKFLADDLQKTEISTSERKLIPVLEILAFNPFPDIAECSINPNQKKLTQKQIDDLQKEFQITPLIHYLSRYTELGIPLKRKGREEEVKVLSSFLNDELEIKQAGNNKTNFQ